MKPLSLNLKCTLAFVVAGLLAAGPAAAQKPGWAGKGGKSEHADRQDEQRGDRRDDDDRSRGNRDDRRGDQGAKRDHFESRHRVVVREYYETQYQGRRCPPGLAKKHNGCMPPGQARKWEMGRPLPREVIYYEVPRPLVVQIGVPPSGYRYVRVASDILMIAIGTGMVVDAIQDLGR